ncbi:carboxymuconolactone decarboxylase family protein [Paenibacillus sp. J5C_2022]|uniref:carboxymuconolactone decarboxylase family protein n=1 Tax=Paenibacillus sp. J5C2022 TaxID=2977129 RepID=UPI0021D1BF98|nr:carboxymuconolactone decarboxylase family protein [Paenibacillus sp. J5C2022]MCU6708764.1 carboxymuconolactone decarboxylase family protein [Paenibacillus sp. J5C2022]
MDSKAYERGMEMLHKMVGPDVMKGTVERVAKFSPDMARLVVEFPFGSLYSRPGLDLKQRSLITISSLVTQGAVDQMDFHIHAALNAGLTPNEIVEAVMHCLPYAGFPKSLGALGVVIRIFEERGVTVEA